MTWLVTTIFKSCNKIFILIFVQGTCATQAGMMLIYSDYTPATFTQANHEKKKRMVSTYF